MIGHASSVCSSILRCFWATKIMPMANMLRIQKTVASAIATPCMVKEDINNLAIQVQQNMKRISDEFLLLLKRGSMRKKETMTS